MVTRFKLKLVRDKRVHYSKRPQLTSPTDAYNAIRSELENSSREILQVVMLDTKNRIIGTHDVAMGSKNEAIVNIGEVFKAPLLANSNAIIMAHNHPSGEATPSPEDVTVTRHLVEAGQLLGIEVLDHLIIGENNFVSLKERGLGF